MKASPIKQVPPPLRFLALVVGGWICVRAAILFPGGGTDAAPHVPALAPRPKVAAPIAQPPIETASVLPPGPHRLAEWGSPPAPPAPPAPLAPLAPPARPSPTSAVVFPERSISSGEGAVLPSALATRDRAESLPSLPAAARSTGSAWLLVRRDSGRAALAPGGTLGGSQAGARILSRVTGGLALSGRAYAPLRRPQGAELAAGLDWRPTAAIPLNILAERRQALGREGRSAFSIAVYGGMSRTFAGRLRLDAYAQAGIVGLKARDAFFDGAARLSVPVGPVEVGGGAWGAAQPGASRLDAGPSLSYRLPVAGAHLRLQADWRLRVAGDAAPGSGPALTLAADF